MKSSKLLSIGIVGVMLVIAVGFVAAQGFGSFEDGNPEPDYDKISPLVLDEFEDMESVAVTIYTNDFYGPNQIPATEFDSLIDSIGQERITKRFYPEGFIAELSLDEVLELSGDDRIGYIVQTNSYSIDLQDSVQIVNATSAWELDINGVNLDGAEQTVCVLDTGIDFSHPDLEHKDVLGYNLDCTEFGCPPSGTTDTVGHGTHVAGIAAAEGQIDGISKGANLIAVKVFEDGEINGMISSNLVRGLNWCTTNAENYNISVISMSLGTDNLYEGNCDIYDAQVVEFINSAVSDNIAVVAATGNDASNTSLSAPSCVSTVIPVGATTKDDELWQVYNQSGELVLGSNYNNVTQLFSPGEGINSTCFQDDIACSGDYGQKSGTSMSTPMVSGAIAIINQALELNGQGARSMHPIDEIEPLLADTGDEIIGLEGTQWKRINIGNAVQTLIPEPMCVHDLDGDGVVGTPDFLALLGAWGPNPGHPADFNGDGVIGTTDFLTLLANWGPCGEGVTEGPSPSELQEINEAFEETTGRNAPGSASVSSAVRIN